MLGISGVESGKAAPLTGGLPGAVEHVLAVVEPPSGLIGEMVPVALPPPAVEVVADVPSGNGAIPFVLVTAGAAIMPSAVVVPAVVGTAPVVTGADEVACAGIGEQLTLVPAVVGSSASGTGARVVSGAPGCVAAENGPGPVRGDDTIAPGVDGIPMAVVPMVETCAIHALPPSRNAIIAPRKDRIATDSLVSLQATDDGSCASLSTSPAVVAARPCGRRPD